jgi:DNA-binding HxlR family transcriptional regulator
MESSDTTYGRQVALASELLSQSKWRVQILCARRTGPVRRGQLVRLIPGASKKMLTENPRKLEAGGIVVRKDLTDVVLHIEYHLEPEFRQDVCALLDHMAQWGNSLAQHSWERQYIAPLMRHAELGASLHGFAPPNSMTCELSVNCQAMQADI